MVGKLPISMLCIAAKKLSYKDSMYRGERGELTPGANWHTTCFCSPVSYQPMAMMFLCCTYTNQNTKNLWRPNPSWFKNYHDKPFLNHMSILFNNSYFFIFIVMLPQWWKFLILLTRCNVF